jgi:hypothetical protein
MDETDSIKLASETRRQKPATLSHAPSPAPSADHDPPHLEIEFSPPQPQPGTSQQEHQQPFEGK